MKEQIQANYGRVAQAGLGTHDPQVQSVAEAFGYTASELTSIPAEANMGLSCGNPTAFASLRSGEVVVDLGCGGGLDVFLAAQKVGPTGRAIGIDMTRAMLDLARRNAAKAGLANVEFYEASIDALPLSDATVDCIISNCVINLAEDKAAVFREMARVLKPGGRAAISDIALKQELPAQLRNDVMAYIGCIAGAIAGDAYRNGLKAAGFESIEVVDTGADLNAYAMIDGQSGCCSPAMNDTGGCCAAEPAVMHLELGKLSKQYDLNAYAASVRIFAVKAA